MASIPDMFRMVRKYMWNINETSDYYKRDPLTRELLTWVDKLEGRVNQLTSNTAKSTMSNVLSAGQEPFSEDLQSVLMDLMTQLLDKNRKYGDAALNPQRTFARSDAVELINVRLDDKLNRIKNRQNDDDEDPEWDLMGYLVLKRIAVKRRAKVPVEPMKEEPNEANKNPFDFQIEEFKFTPPGSK
jgi:hypothetical protein